MFGNMAINICPDGSHCVDWEFPLPKYWLFNTTPVLADPQQETGHMTCVLSCTVKHTPLVGLSKAAT